MRGEPFKRPRYSAQFNHEMKKLSIMNDAAVNQRTDRMLFVWLFLIRSVNSVLLNQGRDARKSFRMREEWAIQDLNLCLLPCVGSTAKSQSAENKGLPLKNAPLQGFSVFDGFRYFSIVFDIFGHTRSILGIVKTT